MSASQTWSGLSAVKFRASRFGATGRLWRLAVGRGGRRGAPRGGRPPSRPPRAPRPRGRPARIPPPSRARLGGAGGGAVTPPAGGEDTADLLAQLGFRLGTALDGGDRVEPSVEAADAGTDDSAQRGHGVMRPLGRYEGELRHAIPLAKKAAALRRMSTSSSSRFTSRFSRCVSACSALRTASASAEPAARCSVRQWLSCPVPMQSSVATSDSPLPPSSSRFTACALNSLVKLRRVRLSAILPSWGAWFVSKPSSPRGEVQVPDAVDDGSRILEQVRAAGLLIHEEALLPDLDVKPLHRDVELGGQLRDAEEAGIVVPAGALPGYLEPGTEADPLHGDGTDLLRAVGRAMSLAGEDCGDLVVG